MSNTGPESTVPSAASVVVGAISLPTSMFALQLRNGQFAIGMWVIAEVFHLLVNLDHSVGRFTGTSLVKLTLFDPQDRRKYTYWLALASTAILLGLVFAL